VTMLPIWCSRFSETALLYGKFPFLVQLVRAACRWR
jgi:uncharacterized protein YjiS (DUF1127 family)